MLMKIEVEMNINVQQLRDKVMNNSAFWTFAATEWHRLYAPYVPYKTGMLDNTVSITPGEIEHTVPYARYQYYGETHNFSREQHPLASAKWDLAAEPTQKSKLILTLQRYVDSGRLNL